MKKNLFYLFALICSMGLSLSACSSDDDDDKGKEETIADISGNYEGSLVVDVDGNATEPLPQTITIVKGNQTSQIVLSLKNFALGPIEIGDIEVPSTVKQENGVQSFSGQADLIFDTALGQLLGAVPTSVQGTVTNGKISIKIDVAVGEPLNQTVKVTFNGDKKE